MIIHDCGSFVFCYFYPGGGHIGFRQYGGRRGRPSWRPSKIEKVWFGQHMCQIWCFWKKLNQKSLTALTITASVSIAHE